MFWRAYRLAEVCLESDGTRREKRDRVWEQAVSLEISPGYLMTSRVPDCGGVCPTIAALLDWVESPSLLTTVALIFDPVGTSL